MFRLVLIFLVFFSVSLDAQQFSSARVWNEMVLNAIRNDFARPTVHARNLFHTSVAMYDAFAVYDNRNETYFLGKTIGGYTCEFSGVPPVENVSAARDMAISYAVFRLIEHRFRNSPLKENIVFNTELVFSAFGYDKDFRGTDYESGDPAALGNYIAESLIQFGLQDGSNELDDYANIFYSPINPELNPFLYWDGLSTNETNQRLVDPNRWQKLDIPNFVGQGGIPLGGVPPFLSPEWGFVQPFAMTDEDVIIKERDGEEFVIYHDPGPPPVLDTLDGLGTTDDYIWGFTMTAHWRSHTVRDTNTLIDISPRSIGNSTELPQTREEVRAYYNFLDGGDYSIGHEKNPVNNKAYEPQIVPRSDYATVLAEFWADGPNSETPPGHWYTILNYVNDQEGLVKKYKGEGPELSDLEWDVKAYLLLGGAMHDSAISAWSAKGFYDYPRPISAIRYMVDKGQSSDPTLPNYHKNGIMLVPGSIDVVEDGDQLAWLIPSTLDRIQMKAFISGSDTIFTEADLWFPYQAVNFVNPPFAGYVSGHSTFSRAAAEILTMLTGDPFFPGGLGEFHFDAWEYLEFGEQGPTKDMSLQWATYVDAANQSALSRIWGGIHPPIDDIPGRIMGVKVARQSFEKADALFGAPVSSNENIIIQKVLMSIYPNPAKASGFVTISFATPYDIDHFQLVDSNGQTIVIANDEQSPQTQFRFQLSNHNIDLGIYTISAINSKGGLIDSKKIILIK